MSESKIVEGQRYLRQAKTGRIYVYSKVLALRKDMSEYDPVTAEYRIKKKQERLKDLKEAPPVIIDPEIIKNADIEADLDRKIEEEEQKILKEQLKKQGIEQEPETKSEEELEHERRQEIIDTDPEIKAIEAMTEIQEIIDYVGEEYGQEMEFDPELELHHYQAKAIILRTERLFESKE